MSKPPPPSRETSSDQPFEHDDRLLERRNIHPPGSFEDLHFKFTRRLTILGRQWRAELDEGLKTIGHTQARWAVLFWILASDEDTTQQELALRVGIKGPTLVFILNKLESEGLIERRPVEGDRRTKTVRLTEAARPTLTAIQQIAGELRSNALKNISAEELATCISVFDRMRENLGR